MKVKTKTEVEVKYLLAEAGARYWEDATVNGVEDTEGDLVPCRDGEYWKPLINLETGQILNWTEGTTADIHYKCCDDGTYHLLDADKNIVKTIESYVPNIMSPGENGFGDYVIMSVDEKGFIQDWDADLSDFEDE